MLSRLLKTLFCCPDPKKRRKKKSCDRGNGEAEKKGSSGEGWLKDKTGLRRGRRRRAEEEVDEECWLVETMESRRGKECEMSGGSTFPREAATLAVAD